MEHGEPQYLCTPNEASEPLTLERPVRQERVVSVE